MTIDETINGWTAKRDQLETEYTQITKKPYLEAFKQEGLVSAASTFLTLQYLTHRHFLNLDVNSIYIAGASVVLGIAIGFVSGSERGYSLRESEKREYLRDEINSHNEVLQSMRNHPERYDPEVGYKTQVARLEK